MFTIQEKYSNAVANFAFVDWKEDLELTIPASDLDAVVKEVALKIITASQLREMGNKQGLTLSLRDATYISVQALDQKHNQDTPAKIAAATDKAKTILSHVVKKLSADFEQLTTADLNVLALLFGIQRISTLAADRIVAPAAEKSKAEQMKEALAKLMALRSKYPPISDDMEATTKAFLLDVNAKINEYSELLIKLNVEAASDKKDKGDEKSSS